MKKTITTLALATTFILSSNAFAQTATTAEVAPTSAATVIAPTTVDAAVANPQGGFTGPTIDPITVAEAQNLSDDTPVVLTGKIEKDLGNEKYIFSDTTGMIVVEIDDEDWNGITAGINDNIEIHGEIDKDLNSIKVDVNKIIKK